MLKKNSIVLLLSIILITLLTTSNIYALSCAEPLSIEENFKNYEVIIIGEVLSVKEKKQSKLLTINVQDNLKGIEEKELIIQEDKLWGESKEGNIYVFYLNKDKLNQWENPLCSPTSELKTEIDKAKEFALNNNSNIKENMQEPKPNEKVNTSNEIEVKEEIEEEVRGESEKSTIKQTIILSIILLILTISTFVYIKGKNKN